MTSNLFVSLCTVILLLIITNKLAECTRYKAGVVEYYYEHESKLAPKQILQNNINKYVKIVEEFSKTMAKIENGILVFPECGLTDESNINDTSVPVPEPNNHQNNFSGYEVIDTLSKAAKKCNTWLVVNLLEKDAEKYYNTDVVFNSNGTIAAKYRKYNLFGEPLDQPSEAEIVSFTTDFNVTFGVFTCFDIMYYHPALDLVAKGIKHIIFPTAWFSELPFLTAIQYQKSWSWSNNVLLLAAGLSNSKVGNTGSGIYGGRTGHDVYYQTTNSNESQLLMVVLDSDNEDYFQKLDVSKKVERAETQEENRIYLPDSNEFNQEGNQQNQKFEDVKTHHKQTNSNGFVLKLKQEPLTAYTTTLIAPEGCKIPSDGLKPGHISNCTINIVEKLCNHDLCCDFTVTTIFTVYICKDKSCQEAETYHPKVVAQDDFSLSMHRLAAFNGVRSFDVTTGGVQTCAVVFCRDTTLSSCGLTPIPKTPGCFMYDANNNACVLRRYITYVNIGGQFSEKNTFITPNILLQSIENTSQFGKISNDFQMNNNNGYYTLIYNASSEDVLGTVAIWNRVFDRDGQQVTDASSTFYPSILTAIMLILIYPVLKILKPH